MRSFSASSAAMMPCPRSTWARALSAMAFTSRASISRLLTPAGRRRRGGRARRPAFTWSPMSGPKAATRVSICAAIATSSLAKKAPTSDTERSDLARSSPARRRPAIGSPATGAVASAFVGVVRAAGGERDVSAGRTARRAPRRRARSSSPSGRDAPRRAADAAAATAAAEAVEEEIHDQPHAALRVVALALVDDGGADQGEQHLGGERGVAAAETRRARLRAAARGGPSRRASGGAGATPRPRARAACARSAPSAPRDGGAARRSRRGSA